ncbi:pyridoxamine 5'-phosphate oxidase family protein [Enemella sp. A6]|uniref:pyridoxamine 5'-phosphate oxidase family protein n=1 Tax=Enemella sp. A6 TaxID=3440152 RepID=UPI003EB754F1
MTQAEVLDVEQCWEMLERHELARLGYLLDDRVHVMPINYGTHEGELVFATAPDSKLAGVLTGHDVVIEIDEIDGEIGRSVIVRGRGSVVAAEDEIELTQVRVRPWLDTTGDLPPRDIFIRVDPTEITGRAYQLRRPWKSMLR